VTPIVVVRELRQQRVLRPEGILKFVLIIEASRLETFNIQSFCVFLQCSFDLHNDLHWILEVDI
jgi:hypothetical protein